MKWTAITVTTTRMAADAVTNMFNAQATGGIQIDDHTTRPELDDDTVQVTAYVPANQPVTDLRQRMLAGIDQLRHFGLDAGAGSITVTTVDDSQWANVWEQYYHPVRLTRYLTVVPRWEDYQPKQSGEIVIRLDPGQAFGTGTHPTTRLVLQLLETVVRGGEQVIDVGTGSGVLAVAAARLGAAHILATDVDDVAVTSALKNIRLNPGVDVDVIASDLLTSVQVPVPVDLVLANMLPDVLERLVPQVPPVLRKGGHLILSGILVRKATIVRDWLKRAGLQITTETTDGKWIAFLAVNPGTGVA